MRSGVTLERVDALTGTDDVPTFGADEMRDARTLATNVVDVVDVVDSPHYRSLAEVTLKCLKFAGAGAEGIVG